MKKIFLAIVLVFSLGTMYAFTGEEAVSKQAVDNFKKEFANAKEVVWAVGNDYYKVSFLLSDQQLYAYYSQKGEFIAITRYISSFNLPLNLQNSLKKNFNNYWVTDLFEVADADGTFYYVTLENADTQVILKATAAEGWSLFKKTKKS